MQEINMENNELISKLKNVKIFTYLNQHEIEDITSICKIFKYDEQEKITDENEISPYLYAVLDGMISVMVKKPDGDEVFIAALGNGDVFGETAIFTNKKRTASIVSNDSVIVQIERDTFMNFIKQHPASGIKILMLIIYSLLNKLRGVNQELAFERKANISQDEIDSVIGKIFKD
ncbi:MAG: cyclic nucleotide-binding domain-containing protein [Spirochaetes bacterium]|nr:cyclic nucleotide-binding domain-containing protein [Spirochaetota bacterium]